MVETGESNESNESRSAIRVAILPCAALNLPLLPLIFIAADEIQGVAQIIAVNLITYLVYRGVKHCIVHPLKHMAHEIGHLRAKQVLAPEMQLQPFSIANLAREVQHLGHVAAEYYHKHSEVSRELAEARHAIAQFSARYRLLIGSTSREHGAQHRAVLGYANYLEERVMAKQADPVLRYDFDDVCESSFSLTLLTNAMAMLDHAPAEPENVSLASMLQQTLIKLAPALDRRSMKLSSAGVDMSVGAHKDVGRLSFAVWMMLLGLIRYAQDESTLSLRTHESCDGREAILSIIVSELSPGSLSEDERGDYLARRISYHAPHMFAETVREQANVQLASLLLEPAQGRVIVVPLTATSCEVSLALPIAIHRA